MEMDWINFSLAGTSNQIACIIIPCIIPVSIILSIILINFVWLILPVSLKHVYMGMYMMKYRQCDLSLGFLPSDSYYFLNSLSSTSLIHLLMYNHIQIVILYLSRNSLWSCLTVSRYWSCMHQNWCQENLSNAYYKWIDQRKTILVRCLHFNLKQCQFSCASQSPWDYSEYIDRIIES